MRKIVHAIFVISTLVVLVLCSACVSQPAEKQASQQNGGLQQIIVTESPYISFDIAKQNLRVYQPDPANESTRIKTIYFIHGTNIDPSGNASSWIFGVQNSNKTELLAYDLSGWKEIPWNVSLSPEEIDLEGIISPNVLFSKNNALIFGGSSKTNSERRDLDLIRGVYTLTITSGNNDRILTFNATTGDLIT